MIKNRKISIKKILKKHFQAIMKIRIITQKIFKKFLKKKMYKKYRNKKGKKKKNKKCKW